MLDKSKIYINIPNVTAHEFVLNCIKEYGNAVAFVDNTTKVKLTYAEIYEGSKRLATSLYKHGVRKGDIVGIISETTAFYGLVSLAVLACGGIASPCNPLYTKAEMKHQYAHSGAKFMICSELCMPVFTQIIDDLSDLRKVFTFQRYRGCLSIGELIQSGSVEEYPPPVSFDPSEDIAILPYSSGTTGLSKGVILTHKNILAFMYPVICGGVLSRNDIAYGVVPSFHIYGFGMQFSNMAIGSKMITDARFDFKTMLEVIQREKVTLLFLVPPLMVLIAKSLEVDKYDVSSVRKILCGAAPLASSLAEDVVKKLKNAKIAQGYGLTECAPGTLADCVSTPTTSIGSVCVNTEIRIVDPETDREMGVDEDGEIWIRGPQIMKGYFKNPEATRRAIDKDGWFHTGDIGHVDKHGFYYIVDRLKELIKYKGFQVAPAELEALLLQHPQIDDAAVIGVPDAMAGELPKAFVVRKTNALTKRDVQDFVKGKVSHYKELQGGVEFIAVIPKSASGKILRRFLRNSAKSKL